MPFLMSFALEHEIVTFAWVDNAFVQFPLNFYATKRSTKRRKQRAQSLLNFPWTGHLVCDCGPQQFAEAMAQPSVFY